MPSQLIHVGPFAAVYIATTSGDFTQLFTPTTAEQRVHFSQPESFSYWDGNSLQSGPVSIQADMQFLSDDPNAVILAGGNPLGTSTQDTPSMYQLLSLLLIHPDDAADSSFYIPTCYVKKDLSLAFSKTAPTVTPLTFFYQQLNRYTPQLFYKRSVDALASILGARSPF